MSVGSRCKAFGLALVTLLAYPAVLHADAHALQPFKAHYQAVFDMGLTLKGTATRSLRREQNRWVFSQAAETMVATIEEKSRFSTRGRQLIPQHYTYARTLLGKERHAELTFNWDEQQVINDVQDKPWTLPIEAGTLDKLNYQLQLRQDLQAGVTDLNYQIADGGKIKQYRFEILGEETLDTALGKLPTIKVKRIRTDGKNRDTLIWFARNLNYLLVKLTQRDDKGKRFDLLIQRLDNGGA